MNLVIRTDASSEIGTGHLMRCFALAQSWQKNQGQVVFYINDQASVLASRLISQSIQVVYLNSLPGSNEDAHKVSNLAQQFNCQWIVIDGYHFNAEYQRIIKYYGLNLLFIDDYGQAKHYYADIVLNQNISAHESLYINREPYTQLLLGTCYTLLRQEFWQWQGWQRINPTIASKLLITMGGADSDNVTFKVIEGLQLLSVKELEVVVVVGGNNPHYEQLKLASQALQFPIQIERNVTNMPELMAWADLAVTAGGSTCWELAFMGLPSLILILAENQRAIAQKLNEMGVSIHLGWHEDVSAAEIASAVAHLLRAVHTRVKMTRCGQELVDGEGSKRVLKHLEAKLLKLRLAYQEDCRLLWEWSNDPEVRAVSFSTELIPWEHHAQWFQSRLYSPTSIVYIGLDRNDVPIGQIRYELEGDKAIISISIDRKFRYQGYGIYLINLGCEKLFLDSETNVIHAYTKLDNKISIKAFLKAGFKNMGKTKLGEHEVVDLVKYK
ncbi:MULTISPECIES: UDP-2,4-diacetamido-2,4,6-trideoxy-beta-L-altropyranose hydrolase [unclassified Nostoc]|uniref:UDP-2,4-diacetamido-2,4, 6-trideoxy-beta-L-altropyranose hydrolase n=1 Tax=unclassified Nostoc TaxID=2593658 RepID=UPI0013D4C803|nr:MULTISPECIES: UDP-2,4-diacetamido-2,4,6-trideoxy-beta-L-altropyranose hydrolase [unclassified Nostoc]MBE8998098.1 UDP-2,4-diacetamido-2,4,6-trideoxy-beta-L-altropyranose hydrolase [Nostoc sp. LEGE 12447]NEU80788.1 UDP-2,4-diacetamido-2,4,6-trideoxy-beta-L-altropyranose hydrolase [Nostoc sp. UIC 10630]